jgi:hypothetical protein
LFAYPACEEIEMWEAPRYVAQGRRTRADGLRRVPGRDLANNPIERSRLLH